MSEAPTQPTKVFISYRRSDAEREAHLFYKMIAKRFGEPNVFLDVDTIGPGEEFPKVISAYIESARACLVLIGPQWLAAKDDQGRRRLEQPSDFVRQEVKIALEAPHCLVIPVLLGSAKMPSAESLPADLRPLAMLHAVSLERPRAESKILTKIEERISEAEREALRLADQRRRELVERLRAERQDRESREREETVIHALDQLNSVNGLNEGLQKEAAVDCQAPNPSYGLVIGFFVALAITIEADFLGSN